VITILGEDLDYDKSLSMRWLPAWGRMGRWGRCAGSFAAGPWPWGSLRRTKGKKGRGTRLTRYRNDRQFDKEFGAVQCRDLIHLNLMDPADRKKFDELGLRKKCSGFVARNVENVRRILKEK
jgi:hypothetical protein